MIEFIKNTLTDPGIFWGAVEALATVGALIFLLVELPKIRREKASFSVEGLKFASEFIETNKSELWDRVLIKSWKNMKEEYSEMVETQIVDILYTMDFLAKLIEIEFLDKELFLLSHSVEYWSYWNAIRFHAQLDNYNLQTTIDRYSDGFELLEDMNNFFINHYASSS
jgi:hypothetical protein